MVKRIILITFVLLAIILIILIIYKLKKNIKIIFNSALETRNFILNDTDNYIKNMSKADLIARNVSNYLLMAANDALSFSIMEKQKILYMMKNVNKMLIKLGLKINLVKLYSRSIQKRGKINGTNI